MSGEEPGPSALLSDLASLPGLRASVQQVVGSASSLPDESSVALFKQLLAHYYAAEDRGRYLERQLCAVSDIVQIQEVCCPCGSLSCRANVPHNCVWALLSAGNSPRFSSHCAGFGAGDAHGNRKLDAGTAGKRPENR